MDQYVRQSQKSNLWARRRNNTANKLLQGQLKHLERGYAKDYRQYLRDKMRLQCELMELEEVPSKLDNSTSAEWDLNETEYEDLPSPDRRFKEISFTCSSQEHPKTAKMTPQSRVPSSPRRPVTSNSTSQTELQLTDSSRQNTRQNQLSESRQKQAKVLTIDSEIISSPRPISSVSMTSSTQNMTMKSHNSFHNTSNPPEPFELLKRANTFGPGDGQSGNLNSSPTESLCRYSPDYSLQSLCSHFPCTVPITYHTLGFRREDLCPWTSDLVAGTHDKNRNSNVRNFSSNRNIPQDRSYGRLDASFTTDIKSDGAAHGYRYVSDGKNSTQKEQFRRVHGPLFSPKPRDPILERIRSGSVKSLPSPPSTARVTVKDKIRGLKQLISEMKARNDRTKPLDWAVNYGQRLPSRMLLNPVVPISD